MNVVSICSSEGCLTMLFGRGAENARMMSRMKIFYKNLSLDEFHLLAQQYSHLHKTSNLQVCSPLFAAHFDYFPVDNIASVSHGSRTLPTSAQRHI